jgi:hypothetical protein
MLESAQQLSHVGSQVTVTTTSTAKLQQQTTSHPLTSNSSNQTTTMKIKENIHYQLSGLEIRML